MSYVPSSILKKLYNRSSLRNVDGGVCFSIKNRLIPASLEQVHRVVLNGQLIPGDQVSVGFSSGAEYPADQINPDNPVDFPLASQLTFHLSAESLNEGKHDLELVFDWQPFGKLKLEVSDSLKGAAPGPGEIPRDPEDDYGQDIIRSRQEFIHRQTGASLEHVSQYSFDPRRTQGNIENFTGAVQVPLGFAGPLLLRGEHAQGEFYVPLATSEGTLVASYNRGMKVLHESGGVKCAVVGDNMQRAPVFVFEDASQARRFANWIVTNTNEIKSVCEASDPFIRLKHIDYYLVSKFAYLRFNYTTGDAAGQNMVGKATFAACNWILQNCDEVEIQRFFLEGNLTTDKKASMINLMRTRGKRVTAEAVIKRDVLLDIMHVDTESVYYHSKVANIGTMLAGANNNGCHSANAITAVFMATGQDVGKVNKFAEIVAGTVLAGEISLAAAISSLDWVSSHEQMGRNSPVKGKL